MELLEIIDNFKNSKIAVVGDIMLDVNWNGFSDRLSPEAPIPIVKMKSKNYALGGAGNVAMNISSLGGKAEIFGYIANDESGRTIKQILKQNKIKNFLYPELDVTTTKIRIIADNFGNYGSQVVRLDLEKEQTPSKKIEDKLIYQLRNSGPDLVVISDYAKGAITKSLLDKLKNFYKIIIDPRPQNMENYYGAYLITPNLNEGKLMSGKSEPVEIGNFLKKKFSSNILLTMGPKGMMLFYEDYFKYFPTKAKEVVDVCGAGDTVIASVALARASGANLEQAVFLSNHSAGIVVEKAGTAQISRDELKYAISPFFTKEKTLEELVQIRRDLKRKNKKVVWTNGCFDIFHAGHAYLLREAKKLGDYLVVGLNDDSSIKQIKGKDRPFNMLENRIITLSNSEFVDAITVFSDLDSSKILKKLKPDIYVKGGDYDLDKIDIQEREILEKNNVKIYFIPRVISESTSQIANKISQKIKVNFK